MLWGRGETRVIFFDVFAITIIRNNTKRNLHSPTINCVHLKTIYTCILKSPAINKLFVSLICFNNLPPGCVHLKFQQIFRDFPQSLVDMLCEQCKGY